MTEPAQPPTAPQRRRRPWPGATAARVLVFLAWRNVWRNRVRSLLTAGGVVVGLTLMIAYLALMEGLFVQMLGFATNIAIGHVQVHRAAYVADQEIYAVLPNPLLDYLEQRTPHLYAPRLYAAGLASAGDSSSGAFLKGVDPVREPRVTDLHRRVRRGTFDLVGTRQVYPHGPNGPAVTAYPVAIGHNMAKNLQIDLGAELVLITQAVDGSIGNGLFEVRAIMNAIDPAFDRMGVLMSLEAVNSLMFLERGVHELAVHVDDVDQLDAARDEIAAEIAGWPGRAAMEAGPGGATRTRTWKDINPELSDMLVASQSAIYFVAVIVFLIAAMGVLNTMLMATYERRHELAILIALGMGRLSMMTMVMLEAFFLACFAAVVGSAVGMALAWYLQVYGFDYSRWLPEGLDMMGVIMEPIYYGRLRPEHVVISVSVLLVIVLIAALLPAWRTARMNPARALHP